MQIYAPEQWGTLEKFNKFYSNTFNFDNAGKRSVSGALSHFRKAETLRNLATKIAPNIVADENEMNHLGFSHCLNTNELSAVIESVVLELYSSIDCTRKVITSIYPNIRGIPTGSTRKFFAKIQDKTDELDEEFPEQLVTAVVEASWYEDFRKIRDELTHLETGNCSKDRETGKIRYMHSGFNIDGRALIIEDIFEEIEQNISNINQFLGQVFAYLYTQLNDKAVPQLCCILEGRPYLRDVSPIEATDFHGGICRSKEWFDLDQNPKCIFANNCGAYSRLTSSW